MFRGKKIFYVELGTWNFYKNYFGFRIRKLLALTKINEKGLNEKRNKI